MLDNCLRRRLNTNLFCENIARGSTDLKRTDQNSSKFKAHSILQGALLLLRALPEIKSLAHETGTVPVLVLLSPGLQFNSFIGTRGVSLEVCIEGAGCGAEAEKRQLKR